MSRITDEKAYRVCTEHGEWLEGDYTNYSQCVSLIEYDKQVGSIQTAIGYMLFILSSVSIILLCTAIYLFTYMKNLEYPSIKVHKNLCFSLLINGFLLLIISCPIVFGVTIFRDIAILCKLILSSTMFSSLSSIKWMFVEGLLLHSRVTTSIFQKKFPFRIYYTIGWGLPLLITLTWTYFMSKESFNPCWEGYNNTSLIWLIKGPSLFVLC
ncbi:corticotropin-releasing factor receptor 2-like protein, partial [Dinothrombium tinctorium]